MQVDALLATLPEDEGKEDVQAAMLQELARDNDLAGPAPPSPVPPSSAAPSPVSFPRPAVLLTQLARCSVFLGLHCALAACASAASENGVGVGGWDWQARHCERKQKAPRKCWSRCPPLSLPLRQRLACALEKACGSKGGRRRIDRPQAAPMRK